MANRDSGNSLLSSRLSGRQQKPSQQVPDVNALRQHMSSSSDIPAYEMDSNEGKGKKTRKEKQKPKPASESPLNRVSSNRNSGQAASAQWTQPAENLDEMPEAMRFDEDLERESLDEARRREKAKVLPQLPDKTRVDMYVEISNAPEYNLAAADLAEYLRQYKECSDWEIRRKMRMEALVRFMTLRSLATLGKIPQAVDFIRTFLDSGKKLIVFCSLHDIVDELKKAFPQSVTVTGRDNPVNKQAAVDAFQNNPGILLVICSIKAAGVGLTLTAASDVAFVELAWTYADCCQCEDRAHRIGQKDNVTCYYLLGRGTIDHTIYSLIHRKKSIANQIMNTDDDIPTDEMYFNELVETFLKSGDYGGV